MAKWLSPVGEVLNSSSGTRIVDILIKFNSVYLSVRSEVTRTFFDLLKQCSIIFYESIKEKVF